MVRTKLEIKWERLSIGILEKLASAVFFRYWIGAFLVQTCSNLVKICQNNSLLLCLGQVLV